MNFTSRIIIQSYILRAFTVICLFMTACSDKQEAIGVTIDQDPLLLEYIKEAEKIEGEHKKLSQEQEKIDSAVKKMILPAEYVEVAKRQIHINSRYLRQMQQRMDYFNVKKLMRQKYITERGDSLTLSQLEKDLQIYKDNKKSLKVEYEWRKNPVRFNTDLLEPKKPDSDKKK